MPNQTKKYTPQFKAKVVLEIIRREKTQTEASHSYGIHRSVLTHWQHEFLERAAELFGDDTQRQAQAARLAELEQMVGKLTMQLEIAKKAASILPMKKIGGL